MEPRLLLCDECASRLTGRARLQLIDTVLKLSGEGHTVVWASSSLEEAARFPRWIYLDKGRIAYDGPPRIADHDTLWAPWTRLAAQAEQRGLWQGELPVSEEQTCVFWRTRE